MGLYLQWFLVFHLGMNHASIHSCRQRNLRFSEKPPSEVWRLCNYLCGKNGTKNMRRIITIWFLALSNCGQPESEVDEMTFFTKYGATELGTTKIVNPSQNIGERGSEQKMIDVSVDDKGATPIIISARVEYVNNPSAIGGPIVGRVLWGIGGGYNEMEFDIPSARIPELLAPLNQPPRYQPMNNTGNGVQVYLGAASHVSVYVRNDGQISSLINVLANGGLVPPLPPTDRIGSPTPAKILLHIQPGTGAGKTRIERTIVVAGGVLIDPLSSIPVLQGVLVSLPPFSRQVRLQRDPIGGPIGITFRNNFLSSYRTVNLGPNDEGPIDIDAASDSMIIQNTGAAPITQLQAVFDVTPM
jgi:hypothetical protein